MRSRRGTGFYIWVAVGGVWSLFLGCGLALLVIRPLTSLKTSPSGGADPVSAMLSPVFTDLLQGAYTTGLTSVALGVALFSLGVRMSLRSRRLP